MNRFFLLLALFFSTPCFVIAQRADELVAAIRQKQALLQTVSYTLTRTDTLVTGTTRRMSGSAQIQRNPRDTVFGFSFRSRRDGIPSEVVYDGQVAYETDDSTKIYKRISDVRQIKDLLYHPGGQVIVPDLIRLDTTKAVRFSVSQDSRYYYLTLHYPDLPAYDVTNRYKTLSVDRTSFLPMAVRHHQETLGKVQDLFYQIKNLQVNAPSFTDQFSEPDFLKTYRLQLAPLADHKPENRLPDQPIQPFALANFDGKTVSSSTFTGKVTLLDFWEVWCGPCLESMPHIQQFSDKYKQAGLLVYGIIHEEKSREAAQRWVQKKGITFPMLLGNAQSRQTFALHAIPRYVLLDRQGKISFQSEGFTPELETAIQQALRP
ncbi:TlpA family protein disulfide reductase [Larkinella sp. VNQ87]|uniref:TlpA family protein disulfide reductase n=1 Tax=Larkinella sp. VNQ87 TaxID=3400921 RepID=UPI003C0DF714